MQAHRLKEKPPTETLAASGGRVTDHAAEKTMNEPKENLPIIANPAGALERVPTVGEMLYGLVKGGVSAQNVGALEKMVELYERVEDRNAEKAFAAAFVELQAEMPAVQAIKPVPDRNGVVKYKFAPLEEIMLQLGPYLRRHGFTVSFSFDYKEDKLVCACTIQHLQGHKRTNFFAVRVGSGPPGATATQSDGAAATYAKRYALCDALNIVIEHDSDARATSGAKIHAVLAEELQERVERTGSNIAAFLKVAGASSFDEIPADKYDLLNEMLCKKERAKR